MSFFDWFKREEGEGRLSRFWKKVKGFITGKSEDDIEKEIQQRFEDSVLEIVEKEFIPLVQSNIRKGDHVYTNYPSGHSVNNIYAEAKGGGRVTVGIRDAAYFGKVEFGTDPRSIGKEEFDRLVDWVKVKDKNGEVQNPYAVANAVAKKIQTEGNTEYAPFAAAMEVLEAKMNKDILKGVEWRFENE